MVQKQTSNQRYQCRSQTYNGTAPAKEALPFILISNKTQRHPLHPHLLVDVRPKILNEYLPSLSSMASYYYSRNTIKKIHFSLLSQPCSVRTTKEHVEIKSCLKGMETAQCLAFDACCRGSYLTCLGRITHL